MKRIALLAVAACVSACAAAAPQRASRTPSSPAPAEAVAYSPLGSACGGLDRSEELVCRSELRISRARQSADPSALACFARKSSELRATYRFASATRDDAAVTDEAAALARERLAAAAKTMERQYAEFEECAFGGTLPPDSVRVSKPLLPSDG